MTIVMEFQGFKKRFQVKSTTIPNWNLGSMHIYYLSSSLDFPCLNAIVIIVIFIFASHPECLLYSAMLVETIDNIFTSPTLYWR